MFTLNELKTIHSLIRNSITPNIRNSTELFRIASIMARVEEIIDNQTENENSESASINVPKAKTPPPPVEFPEGKNV